MKLELRPSGQLAMAIFLVVCLSQVASAVQQEAVTFELQEVSAFALAEESSAFGIGHRGDCADRPETDGTTYPPFKSEEPIYGSVRLAQDPQRADGRDGVRLVFAIDESRGSGKGYDRFYLDLNGDGDLTNDRVLAKQASPPEGAAQDYASIQQQACFEPVGIPLALRSGGTRPLEVMPRLIITDSGYRQMSFVTTRARSGQIDIAGRKLRVHLGHNYLIAGWFDRPWTALHLIPMGQNNRAISWWEGDRLLAAHKVGGTFYRFSATPSGDRLTVRPYDGPLGTFQLGAGGRDLAAMEMSGSLVGEEIAVAIGEVSDRGRPEPLSTCRLPVGDYLPSYLTVTYGRLRINLSNNYHADGSPRDAQNRVPVYGITIREDKPFTLDFSNEPTVLFASPAKDLRVKRGAEFTAKAVLIDPVLDVMVRGLDDTNQKQTKERTGSNGVTYSYTESLSLDPKVVISRADGEVVAEGVMPFG